MALTRVSESVVDDVIEEWRRARLYWYVSGPGGSESRVLADVVEYGPDAVAGSRGQRRAPTDDEITMPERVQAEIERWPAEYRRAFEARYLGLIRGEWCKWPHIARALTLGISPATYWRRVKQGKAWLREWLEAEL